jgi:Amt family ammonium transporter
VKGLFYGGGTGQLRAQVIGSLTAVTVVLSVTLLIMYTIKAIRGSWTLRVSRDGELEGLDIHEHGTPAYHMEFGQGMTYSTPANLPNNGLPVPVPPEKSAEPV